MHCPKCGNQNHEGERYCRHCGGDSRNELPAPVKQNFPQRKNVFESLAQARATDPDELTANGISSVFVGDGFFMVAVILSATHSPVSTLLWLLLLIPAFFLFGKGFSDVLQARQIRRRLKQNELPSAHELPPAPASIIDTIRNYTSGGLRAVAPCVTERTTRELR